MNPTSSQLPALSSDECPICGSGGGRVCRDPDGRPRQSEHRQRYDAKARDDLLAWRNLGANAPG